MITNRREGKVVMLLLLAMLLSVSSITATALAEDNFYGESGPMVNDPMDIDGSWNQSHQAEEKTSEEIIGEAKQKAERKNVKMISKKIVKIRVPERQVKKITEKEKKTLSKRVSELFENGESQDNSESGNTAVASVRSKKEIYVPATTPTAYKSLRIIPTFGVMMIKGDHGVDYNSDLNAGISIESMVSEMFSVGLGLGYATMTLTDDYNGNYSYYNYGNGGQGLYKDMYGNVHTGGNGYGYVSSAEMDYRHFSIDLNTKMFPIRHTRVKPYIGIGVSYNMTSLGYKDDNYYGYYGGSDEYSSDYMSGVGLLGTEVEFTETLGMDLRFKYSRNLFSSNRNNSHNPALARLQHVGESIEEANNLSLSAGLVIDF